MRLLRFICWIRYIFTFGERFDGHFWKLVKSLTEDDAEELEARQAEANKYSTLQILTPHYMKIYKCKVCGVEQTEGGWNNMYVVFEDSNN